MIWNILLLFSSVYFQFLAKKVQLGEIDSLNHCAIHLITNVKNGYNFKSIHVMPQLTTTRIYYQNSQFWLPSKFFNLKSSHQSFSFQWTSLPSAVVDAPSLKWWSRTTVIWDGLRKFCPGLEVGLENVKPYFQPYDSVSYIIPIVFKLTTLTITLLWEFSNSELGHSQGH